MIRSVKAFLALTGPINIVLFFPGIYVVQTVHKDGLGIIKPFFLVPVFEPGLSAYFASLLAEPVQLAILGGLALVALTCLIVGYKLTRSSIDLFYEADGTLAPDDPPKTLVLSWAYAYVRHPMAMGMWLMMVAFGLLLGMQSSLWFAVAYLLFLSIYVPCSEEPDLRTRFGAEWVYYKSNVGAWCPRCTPYVPGMEEQL